MSHSGSLTTSPPGPVLQVLLVEDDEVDRMAVRRLLRHAGVATQVQEATDFGAARDALLHGHPDCVLLDFHLPGGDGLELMQLANGATASAPIIVLTGQGDETLAVELMKAGAVDYLPKRLLTPERLSQSIRQAIRVSQAERRAQKAHDALERQAAQLLLLSSSSLGFHAAITIDETLELVTRLARELIGTHVAAAHVRGDGVPELVCRSHSDRSSLPALTDDDLIKWEKRVWQAGKCVTLSQEAAAAPGEWNGTGKLQGLLAAPLTGRGGQPIGSLLLTEPLAGEFQPGDGLMLVQLTQAASVAIESSRLYREAREATRARDDMMAIVSHDLRNPLGVVGLSAGMLRKTLEGTPDAVLVQRIDRGVRRMSRLIDDLLCASRIDSGTLSVQPSRIKAAALLAEALESVAPLAEAQGCALVAEKVDSAVEVLADQERLMQVFSNILGNALKHVPEGEGRIAAGFQLTAGAGRFQIRDNGSGISQDALPHVFKRSWKARSSEHDGAGLGLYIAKGIIDAHHGTIAVESKPGEGTTVWFGLPLAGQEGA